MNKIQQLHNNFHKGKPLSLNEIVLLKDYLIEQRNLYKKLGKDYQKVYDTCCKEILKLQIMFDKGDNQ